MRCNPFEGQLERLARTLTERFGVTVLCQGENAYTDGRRIILPSLPEPMDEPLERMIVGYLDHEMAHVAYSDFKVVEAFSKKYPGYEAMLNVVEDALIEKLAMQRWPGVRANLDALFRQVRDRVRGLLRKASPFRRFCTAVYLRLSHHGDMLGLANELKGYEDLLDQFHQVRTTADSAELAGKLLQRWSKQGERRTGKRVGAASSRSRGARSRSRRKATTDGSGASGSTELDSPDDARGGGGAGGLTLVTEAIADAIEQAAGRNDGHRPYRVFTKQHDRIDVLPAADAAAVQALQQRGQETARRLRRGLANALRSAEKRWWREEQPRGELSPRTLHRLCLDRPGLDVFRSRAVVQGRSTAVTIVLDASGSMSMNKMHVARDAVRVLLEALHELKIPTEAFTFTTGDLVDVSRAAAEADVDVRDLMARFSRFGNLEIGLVKRFADPLRVALQRLPNVRGTGLTPLGEAMEIGARRLIVRPETRKILLVATDGKPGCEGSGAASLRHAQHMAGRIAASGIELIGVGIIDRSLQDIVPDTVIVNRIEDLPAQLCKLLGRTLQKGVHRVG